MFATPLFLFFKCSQNFPELSKNSLKKLREFLLSQQSSRAVGKERELYFLFQISLQPDAVLEKKNQSIVKTIKIDLQWNNIIFIVTATGVPWESRMLEKFNFYKKKEFTSLSKTQGIHRTITELLQEYSIPHLKWIQGPSWSFLVCNSRKCPKPQRGIRICCQQKSQIHELAALCHLPEAG